MKDGNSHSTRKLAPGMGYNGIINHIPFTDQCRIVYIPGGSYLYTSCTEIR